MRNRGTALKLFIRSNEIKLEERSIEYAWTAYFCRQDSSYITTSRFANKTNEKVPLYYGTKFIKQTEGKGSSNQSFIQQEKK